MLSTEPWVSFTACLERVLYIHFLFINFYYFLRSTFVGSAWSFVFSSPPQRPMTSDLEGFSIPDFIHYIIFFTILILEKEPASISLLIFPFNVECQTRELLVPFL